MLVKKLSKVDGYLASLNYGILNSQIFDLVVNESVPSN